MITWHETKCHPTISYEADRRHAEILAQELGLDSSMGLIRFIAKLELERAGDMLDEFYAAKCNSLVARGDLFLLRTDLTSRPHAWH